MNDMSQPKHKYTFREFLIFVLIGVFGVLAGFFLAAFMRYINPK